MAATTCDMKWSTERGEGSVDRGSLGPLGVGHGAWGLDADRRTAITLP